MTRAETDVQALINLTCRRPPGSTGKVVPVSLEAGQGIVNTQEFGTRFAQLLQNRDDEIRELHGKMRAKEQKIGELVALLRDRQPGETLKQWRGRLIEMVVQLSGSQS